MGRERVEHVYVFRSVCVCVCVLLWPLRRWLFLVCTTRQSLPLCIVAWLFFFFRFLTLCLVAAPRLVHLR